MDEPTAGPTWVIPLGSGNLVPALLLGYETTLSPDHDAWARFGTPPWIAYVDQQAGGFAMTYPQACGVLFRLEGNADHARRDPAALIAAFHAMAEDPRPDAIDALEPRLRDACQTSGEALSSAVLRRLSAAVQERFDLPRCASGIEAFVRLDADPLAADCVLGWRYVEPTGATAGIGELWSRAAPQWRDGPRFTVGQLARLRELGSISLCDAAAPRLFLLWENSD